MVDSLIEANTHLLATLGAPDQTVGTKTLTAGATEATVGAELLATGTAYATCGTDKLGQILGGADIVHP